MGDMREAFDAWNAFWEERRQKRIEVMNSPEMQEALSKLPGFRKYTEWHWAVDLLGDQLDMWPSRNKWRWRNKTYNGTLEDFFGFIKNRMAASTRLSNEPSEPPEYHLGSQAPSVVPAYLRMRYEEEYGKCNLTDLAIWRNFLTLEESILAWMDEAQNDPNPF